MQRVPARRASVCTPTGDDATRTWSRQALVFSRLALTVGSQRHAKSGKEPRCRKRGAPATPLFSRLPTRPKLGGWPAPAPTLSLAPHAHPHTPRTRDSPSRGETWADPRLLQPEAAAE